MKAREHLLKKISSLTLEGCGSMSDFLNKHRQYGQDLRKAGQVYSDGQMVTNILMGLLTDY